MHPAVSRKKERIGRFSREKKKDSCVALLKWKKTKRKTLSKSQETLKGKNDDLISVISINNRILSDNIKAAPMKLA